MTDTPTPLTKPPSDPLELILWRLDHLEALLDRYQRDVVTREVYAARHEVVVRDLAGLAERIDANDTRRRSLTASLFVVGAGVLFNLLVELVKVLPN